MAKRIQPHQIETRSSDKIRKALNSNVYHDVLVRELTGRDYGIDAIVELFDDGNPTGKIAFLQFKGKETKITPLVRTPDFISVKISNSNCYYARQNNIQLLVR